MKNFKILIIAIIAIIIATGGWWYFNKNNGDKNQEEIAFSTGFVLLDDEKNLAWSEAVQLSDDARAQFDNKVKEIKADLVSAKGREQLLADYNNLAIYQKYLGNYREAYLAYLESLKIESQARVVWQNFAEVLLKVKAYKSAEMAYKKAIELNKYIPESYIKLADFYQVMNYDARVEATYKDALSTIKNSLESDTLILNGYAGWLKDKKRYDEAIKIYEELIVKQPENKEAIERIISSLKSK
jgi:tetratricopeptide (TPR) repeat protein